MEVQPGVATAGPKNRRGDRQSIGHQTGSGPTTGWRTEVAKPLPYKVAGVEYLDMVPVDGDRNIALTWQTTEADTIAANVRYFDSTAARWKVFSVQQRATLPAVGTARLYVIQEAKWSDLAGTLDVLPIEYMAAPNTWRPAQVLGNCVPFRDSKTRYHRIGDGLGQALLVEPTVIYTAIGDTVYAVTTHPTTDPSVVTIASTGYGVGELVDNGDGTLTVGTHYPTDIFFGYPGTPTGNDTNPFVPGELASIRYSNAELSSFLDALATITVATGVVTPRYVGYDIPGMTVTNGQHWQATFPDSMVRTPDGSIFLAMSYDPQYRDPAHITFQQFGGRTVAVLRIAPSGTTSLIRYEVVAPAANADGTIPPGVPAGTPLLLRRGGDGSLFTGVTDGAQQFSLAADLDGNVYIANKNLFCVEKWDAVTGAITLFAGAYGAPSHIPTALPVTTPRGAYDPATSYIAHDSVTLAGATWYAMQASTGQLPATGSAYWSLTRGDRGPWDVTASYFTYDRVTYGGNTWWSRTNNSGITPGTDFRWELIIPENGPALDARFGGITGLSGNGSVLDVLDQFNGRVRRIDLATGMIRTIIGGGQATPHDGSDPLSVQMTSSKIITDPCGNVWLTDGGTLYKVGCPKRCPS